MFKRILVAAAAVLPLATGSALATTSTVNNFQVSIGITAGCNISATNIAYGAIQGGALLTTAQVSTAAMGGLVTYQCAAGTGTSPTLTASTGANPTGAQANMKGTLGGLIPYSLAMPAIAAFTGATQTAQITATIPVMAVAPSVDSYVDTVTLTLTY